MKPMIRRLTLGGCVVGLLLLIITLSPVEGQGTMDAVVVFSKGFAEIKTNGKDQFTVLVEGTRLGVGDVIKTDTEAEVEIRLPDKSVLKIGPSSQVVIKELGTVEVTKVSTTTFELIKGKIRAVVSPFLNKESHFTIETTNATVGVRGTDFFETFDPDTESTYIIGLEDCVSLSLKRFPGSAPIPICVSEQLTVTGGQAPSAPSAASTETVNRILREMELKADAGAAVPGVRKPPYITGVFVNRTIDLERLEGALVLTKDDLTSDGKIIISGQARDDTGAVTAVEVSTDGGATFNRGAGTGSWTYDFSPHEGIEYEIMVRAVNDAGLASDPREAGSWTIAFRNVGNEDIVRTFVDVFIGGISTEDVRAVEEVVSDEYDGTIGGYYSKDEMMRDGIEGLTGYISGTAITYSIDQVTELNDRIAGVINWTMTSGATKDQGRTTWSLSRSDNFRLVHAEGDWLLRSIVAVEPTLTLEVYDNGMGPMCNNVVRVLLKAPNIPDSVTNVQVQIQTSCGSWSVLVYRSYYETYVGDNDGFGTEVTLETMISACVTGMCAFYTYQPFDPFFNCSFTNYGYNLSTNTTIP
jgi:hypothetical protein